MTTRGTWVSGLTTGVLRSTGPETILTAFADADGNCGATVTGVVFPLSRLLVAAGFGSVTGLLSGAADAGCGVVVGVVGVVGAAPGVTIFTMFSSR